MIFKVILCLFAFTCITENSFAVEKNLTQVQKFQLSELEKALNDKTRTLTYEEDRAKRMSEKAFRYVVGTISSQKEIDAQLLAELHSNHYSFENPFVQLDPYGNSPLTAIALFKTKEDMKISLEVVGDYEIDSVKFEFDEFKKEHVIPIYGLYPSRINKVILKALNKENEIQIKELFIETEKPRAMLIETKVFTETFQADKYEEGFNFNYLDLSLTAFDSHGKFRWYFTNVSLMANEFNPRGFYYAIGEFTKGDAFIIESNYLGKILNAYHTPFAIHHDIELTKNNSLLLTGGHPLQYFMQDIVSEISLESGEIISYLDYKDIIIPKDVREKLEVNPTIYPQNWLHINSVVEDENSVIISSRSLSSVVKNTKEGKLEWILADPIFYPKQENSKLLKAIGKDFEYPYFQHAAAILDDIDNNPDTDDILLFDNGNLRNAMKQGLFKDNADTAHQESKLYSRLVHYRIHKKNYTAEQIWQYAKDKPELFSDVRGDIDLLKNKNILSCFNISGAQSVQIDPDCVHEDKPHYNLNKNNKILPYTVLLELDEKDQKVWQAHIHHDKKQMHTYKVERMPLYSQRTNEDFLGIEAQIKTPLKNIPVL